MIESNPLQPMISHDKAANTETGRQKLWGARRKLSGTSAACMIEHKWRNDRLVVKALEKCVHMHDSSAGSKMEALPSKTFSSDTLMAGVGLVKEKARVDVLKEPLSDAAALERTVDS